MRKAAGIPFYKLLKINLFVFIIQGDTFIVVEAA